MRIFYLSVHDIVDVLLRTGHLDTRIFNQSSMQEGTRLHALYQREQTEGYNSEYSLSYTFHQDDYQYNVIGKADGIIFKKNETIVEEIKTTVADLDEFIKDHSSWHIGQAMFYAFMIAKEKRLEKVTIRMTYILQKNYAIQKKFDQVYTIEQLESFVDEMILKYTEYQKKIIRRKIERDESVKDLKFPFSNIRDGQKDMMDFVKDSFNNSRTSYIEAPTGIGKTISLLYPSLEMFALHKAEHVFYLTSKNSIKKVAMNTLKMFESQNVKCKSIELTSKENICFNDKKGHCNPDECPFARFYYDKLMNAIFDSIHEYNIFQRKAIEDICYRLEICPYQFQFDLARYLDIVVMDYTYIYDYHDQMQIEENTIEKNKSYLLIDECHNLPERVRDMYSMVLKVSSFDEIIPYLGREEFKDLKNDIKRGKKYFLEIFDEIIEVPGIYKFEQIPQKFLSTLDDISTQFKSLLKKYTSLFTDNMLDFFFSLNSFIYLSSLFEDEEFQNQFLCYTDNREDDKFIKISNLDCRKLIDNVNNFFKSTIFFSATLSPKQYYIDLLGGEINENNHLFLPSPFPISNRKVFIDDRYSLTYRDRDDTLYNVFSSCKNAISTKRGNYFIFCPSYEYMEKIYSFFKQDPIDDAVIIPQGRMMNEREREDFLNEFKEDNEVTTIGLLVQGGVFSEGIDLIGERLIGAIVISVGIPTVTYERECLKEYYNSKDVDGFNYAYTFPGVNKILQASGRVIRSENDIGFIMYIDSRLKRSVYTKIFDEIYPDRIRVISNSQVKAQLKSFWKEHK